MPWHCVLIVQSPHVLVTGLEDYKVRGTSASPFLTVTHYTELMDTKDLVLVRGDVVLPSKLADTEVRLLQVPARGCGQGTLCDHGWGAWRGGLLNP